LIVNTGFPATRLFPPRLSGKAGPGLSRKAIQVKWLHRITGNLFLGLIILNILFFYLHYVKKLLLVYYENPKWCKRYACS